MTSKVEGFIMLPVWSNNGVIQPLVNDDGFLRVINDGDYSSILSRMHSYDGSNWRKQPLIWGYSDLEEILEFDNSANAGTQNLTSDPVPSGEVWKVEICSARNQDTAPSSLRFNILGTSYTIPFHHQTVLTANVWECWTGEVTMIEGDKIQCTMYDCIEGDTIHFYVRHTIMKIEQ